MRLVLALVVCAGVAAVATAAPARTAPRDLPGWSSYERFCLACHGPDGDGRGPAAPWLWPRPRDLTRGVMTWRSTPVGAPATDADLAATIRWGVQGAHGMLMPAFGVTLDDAAIAELVAVVRAFAPPARIGAPRTVSAAVPGDAARGAQLWAQAGCSGCHGVDGRGPAAPMPDGPFDLTTQPLRRPHAPGDEARATFAQIANGAGIMPGFGDALPATDLWALVAHVQTLRPASPGPQPRGWPGPLPDEVIAADRADKLARTGFWMGSPSSPDAIVFGGAIPPQGPAPASLSPAEASLSARRCARCHASQARSWRESIHGAAMSPGMRAQLARMTDEADKASCRRCHAPLAEQQPGGAGFDDALYGEGITCAACHVRGWTRHGPATVDASLLPRPGYPAAARPIYERSDLCAGCHSLPPRLAVAGRPLLDTYREWLTGPYMPRGVQCQHCHMPNREHAWKGVHDPEAFREGIRVEAIAARGASGVVSVRARLWNAGAGHLLPTTPTPAAWLTIELVDARGRPIAGARAERRIGRKIRATKDGWVEDEDTRVPPGESIELAAGWKNGRVAEAVRARVTVRVVPDDYYEGLYRKRLAGKLTAEQRALYQAALERAEGNHYVAETLQIPVR